MTRWVRTGQATADPSARRAGAEAASAALSGAEAALVVVLSASRMDHEEVLAGVRSVTGATPLVGASSTAVFGSQGPACADVVVTALGVRGSGAWAGECGRVGLYAGFCAPPPSPALVGWRPSI